MPVDWSMLPNDVVRLVMNRHWILYHAHENAIREAHRACVRELKEAFCDVRGRYYAGLMDHESGGYGHMLDDDEIHEEMDNCIAWCPKACFQAIDRVRFWRERQLRVYFAQRHGAQVGVTVV